MGLGNLNDTPSPMPRPCRPSTLFVSSNNNQVGLTINLQGLSLSVVDMLLYYFLCYCSLTALTMKLDVSAVHMGFILTWTLFVSVNHWLLVNTSNKRERKDVLGGCSVIPWKSYWDLPLHPIHLC